MYKLTLTYDERRAIDWVGNRYSHGDDLYKLLLPLYQTVDDEDTSFMWNEDIITEFDIPESVAWQIRDIGEECEYRWDCFAPSLAHKLTQFCMDVI